MLVAPAIVLVAAGLLITIWLTARSIVTQATRALKAAEQIRDNTRVIWEMQTTNEVAEQIRDTVCDIEAKATKLVEALHGQAAAGSREEPADERGQLRSDPHHVAREPGHLCRGRDRRRHTVDPDPACCSGHPDRRLRHLDGGTAGRQQHDSHRPA